MGWIVEASVRLRRLILAVGAGVIVVGIVQVGKTPVDALPEFNPPMVEVQTEALGLSTEEVEQLITVPLEQDLLVGVPFLDEIESVSMPGLSSVVMTFEPGTDLLDARQVVQERLTQAVGVAGLPDVAKPPQMIQPLSSNSRVGMLKLSSEELTPIEVSVLARWVIGPRLMSVPGVANVVTWGNRERQLQVLVDPERLAQNDATLAQIVKTAGNALEVSPLSFLEASTPGTGGFIDMPNQRLNIFHEQAIKTSDQLAQVPLEDTGGGSNGNAPLTLGDVTDVVEDHQPLIGDTVCPGGEDCLLLVIEKFPGANTVEVSQGVADALQALQPGLADITFDSSVYRPASYVESSFDNLGWALLVGGLLLLLVLGALFWDWRSSLVSVLAIGVSLAAGVVVLQLLGTTVNLMVAAGLVVGLTVVIHDAVTDVDGLADRLRRRDRDDATSGWRAIVETAAETRRSVLYAALVVAAATLPLFFLGAEGGAFLPPIALSYLLAVAVSMLVAVTVTPALAMLLLSSSRSRHACSPLTRRLRRGYDRVARGLVTRSRAALAVAAGAVVIGLAMTPLLDSSLRPALEERDVLVHIEAEPGTSLPRMTATTDEVVQELGSLPGVANVGSHVGRAVMADEVVDVNSGEVWVHLTSDADYDETVTSIESAVADNPDVSAEVLTYSEERVSDVLGRSGDEVVVRAYGEDAGVLERMATELQTMVAGVDGVATARVDRAPEEATMEVEVDLEKAQGVGLKPGDVRRAAASLLGGITVGNLFDEQKVFDVVVWGDPAIRNSESDVEELLIDAPGGSQVRLGAVADVRVVSSPTIIRHEAVASYLDVIAQVPEGDVGDVQARIDELVDGVAFPQEHHAEILGGYEAQQADRWQLIAAGLGALFAIFLLLQAAFGSWRLGLLGFGSLLLAPIGGVVAVLLSGGTITLGSVAGFLAVLGIAARGVVVLIRRYQYLHRREGVEFGSDLVLRGTGDSLVPTVTSTVATALVLAPIAVTGGVTGFEILGPMVIVVLGGLVTTLLVTLFLVPALYLRFGFVGRDGVPDDLFEDVPEQRPAETREPAGVAHRSSARAVWPLIVPVLFLPACGDAVADDYVIENDPGKAVPIPGTHQTLVVLEESAAERLRIQTTQVETRGQRLVVPSTTIFVDTEGQWWVFTNPEPLQFVREKIGIESVEGARAFLTSGPKAGTDVVTVGVAELYGIEEEVGH